jgi:deoxyribose-phosphate aldolase
MVMPLGRFLAGEHDRVGEHVGAVVKAAGGRPVKVILETALLRPGDIAPACRVAVDHGARFVKTSTGFNTGGATVEAVTAMRAAVGSGIGVKAAGGIRDRAAALAMLEAGADRLGTSASVAIIGETE